MLKYIGAGIATFAVAAVTSAALTGKTTTEKSRPTPLSLSEELKQAVAEVNKIRGRKQGVVVFDGARLNGHTLIYDMIVPNSHRNANLTRGSERIQSLMEKEMCRGKYATFLKRGAAVMFIYKTSGGRELYDSRVDAGICKLPA